MSNKIVRYLVLSQLSLFTFLGTCSVIIPRFLFGHDEGGVSNYGVHAATIVPFTLAFTLSSGFLIVATQLIPKTSKVLKQIRWALFIQAGLLMLVLLSTYPYKLNPIFTYIHIATGISLLLFNLAVVTWITLVIFRDKLGIAILMGEFIGVLVTTFTLLGFVDWLFIAQAITAVFFGIFVIRLGRQIVRNPMLG